MINMTNMIISLHYLPHITDQLEAVLHCVCLRPSSLPVWGLAPPPMALFGVSWSLESTLSHLLVWPAARRRLLQGCPLSLSLNLTVSLSLAGDSGRPPCPISLHWRLAPSCRQGSFRCHAERASLTKPAVRRIRRQTNAGKQGRGGCLSLQLWSK